jgi:hypothetical protein
MSLCSVVPPWFQKMQRRPHQFVLGETQDTFLPIEKKQAAKNIVVNFIPVSDLSNLVIDYLLWDPMNGTLFDVRGIGSDASWYAAEVTKFDGLQYKITYLDIDDSPFFHTASNMWLNYSDAVQPYGSKTDGKEHAQCPLHRTIEYKKLKLLEYGMKEDEISKLFESRPHYGSGSLEELFNLFISNPKKYGKSSENKNDG